MKEVLNIVGISAIISIIVSFVFDTIKYRTNLKFEKCFNTKLQSYNSISLFMSIVLDPNVYRHGKFSCNPETTDDTSITKFFKNELETQRRGCLLYANSEVIDSLSEFIKNPTEKKYENAVRKMRNDLWRRKK